MKRIAPFLVVLVLGIAAVGCSDDSGDSTDDTGSGSPSGTELSGELRVAAAASLTEVFTELGADFEAANPGTSIVFDFGPSSGLADSILEGAPVDVFASADQKNMGTVVDGGSIDGDPEVFATNSMEIAVPAGNPGTVQGLDDFARDELLIGLCAEDVPCGRLAREVLDNASVVPAVDTDEADVKALLGKIVEDELDAGIVYVTDVVAAGDEVEGIEIPADVNVTTDYPIATVTGTDAEALAEAFIAFVLSEAGVEVLEAAGFTTG